MGQYQFQVGATETGRSRRSLRPPILNQASCSKLKVSSETTITTVTWTCTLRADRMPGTACFRTISTLLLKNSPRWGLEDLLDLCERVQSRFDPRKVTLGVDLAEFAEDFVDPDLVRGAARCPYYDGLVFRAYFEGSAQSIGRGGRYDRLFRRLDCDLAAVGFSISVDPLLRGGGS